MATKFELIDSGKELDKGIILYEYAAKPEAGERRRTTPRLMAKMTNRSRGNKADVTIELFFWNVTGETEDGEELGERDRVATVSAYTKFNNEQTFEMSGPSFNFKTPHEVADYAGAFDIAAAWLGVQKALYS